jgi:cytochrome c-type biogenesis protein CcmH
MRRVLFTLVLVLGAAFSAHAVEPAERLADPAQEARARAIGAVLRCLVCRNESIDESGAGLAHDIRVLLREHIAAGDTDAQAIKAIVDRYGEFVLLNPPVKPATYVLWFGPIGMLLIGVLGTIIWMRRRPSITTAMAPLSAAEQRRLETMLQESDR